MLRLTVVSRAFQVLSDPDKKSQFDKFGHDPDNRFASASAAAGASPFSGFARSPGGARGPMFEEEISPEELFRQFFGGGFGGPMGGFGGGGFGGMSTAIFLHLYAHISKC
jgi:DnaJ family protein B protein 12